MPRFFASFLLLSGEIGAYVIPGSFPNGRASTPERRRKTMCMQKVKAASRGSLIMVGLMLGIALNATDAVAAAQDYQFEIVKSDPAGSGRTNVTVRLLHRPDGKPVTNAVIFEAKTDMGPSGMKEMPGKVTPATPTGDGAYRFQTETGMAGRWALYLSAKVQGEVDTVRGTVTYDAGK